MRVSFCRICENFRGAATAPLFVSTVAPVAVRAWRETRGNLAGLWAVASLPTTRRWRRGRLGVPWAFAGEVRQASWRGRSARLRSGSARRGTGGRRTAMPSAVCTHRHVYVLRPYIRYAGRGVPLPVMSARLVSSTAGSKNSSLRFRGVIFWRRRGS